MLNLLTNTEMIEFAQARDVISDLEIKIEELEEIIKVKNKINDYHNTVIDDYESLHKFHENLIDELRKTISSAEEIISFYATSSIGQKAKEWLDENKSK